MSTRVKKRPLFDPPILRRAVVDSFLKLNPRRQIRNPVMFTVFVGSIFTTCLGAYDLSSGGGESGFIFGISAWLWFTVLFANFAEAMAEGRGKAQADSLRATRRDVQAKKLSEPRYGASHQMTSASQLRKDHIVLVEAARACSRTGWWCASPRTRARRFLTA
jgi:K+-transporting ATPase ATPase B chain